MGVMTKVQVAAFFEAARGDRWEALWHLLLTSGLRPGEALGLKWEDLEGNKVRVQRVMIPGSRGSWRLAEPKTDRSRRVVVIPVSTERALRAHRRDQAREKLAAGEHYQDHGLMFAMPDGAPPNYRGLVLSHFKPILAKAGLPPFRPTILRHTAATLLLGSRRASKGGQRRLGHSSTQQTMDTYSHVLPDMQEASAAKLEALLYGPEAQPDKTPVQTLHRRLRARTGYLSAPVSIWKGIVASSFQASCTCRSTTMEYLPSSATSNPPIVDVVPVQV